MSRQGPINRPKKITKYFVLFLVVSSKVVPFQVSVILRHQSTVEIPHVFHLPTNVTVFQTVYLVLMKKIVLKHARTGGTGATDKMECS